MKLSLNLIHSVRNSYNRTFKSGFIVEVFFLLSISVFSVSGMLNQLTRHDV